MVTISNFSQMFNYKHHHLVRLILAGRFILVITIRLVDIAKNQVFPAQDLFCKQCKKYMILKERECTANKFCQLFYHNIEQSTLKKLFGIDT